MSFANALRTLKALAQSVATQIGVGLAAALRHVIIFLREAMKYVLGLAQTFANFMQTLFGKYQGGASAIAMDGLGDADDYANDLADATGDAAGGLGDAADNAEKLRKELSVLPFDELNQLNKDREATTSSGGSGGKGGSGGGGLGDLGLGDVGMDLGDLLEGSEIPDAIQKWALRIRNAFLSHNWFALGRDIAQMFNEGLQKLYDLLDPEKVKEKVFPWIWAFAGTFNSFVQYFDFELLGKTIARGINDIAMIFNEWYDSMNFEGLGAKLSEGLNGLLTEGDFYEWGLALGNKFMIGWDIFAGFVSNEEMWHNLGLSIADGIKGLTAGIRLGEIGTALSDFINGICETLETLAEDEEMWQGVADNIVTGINNFIGNMEWTDNGQKLDKFIERLVDLLVQVLGRTNWEDFGTGLSNMLAQVHWGEYLIKVGLAIIKALGSILKGLIKNPEGAIAVSVLGGFAALNIGSKIFTLFGGSTMGASITGGIAKSVGISAPIFGTMVAGTLVQAIATASAWDKIPTVTSGKILSSLEKLAIVVNNPTSVWRQALMDGFEGLTGKEIPDVMERGISFGFASPVSTAASLIGTIIDKVKEKKIPENVNAEVGRVNPLLASLANNTMSTFGGNLGSGYASSVVPELNRIHSGIGSNFSAIESETEKSGANTIQKYGQQYSNTQELTSNLNTIKGSVSSTTAQIQADAIAKANATASGYGRAWANRGELNAQLSAMSQHISSTVSGIQSAVLGFGGNTISGYGRQFGNRAELNNQLNTTKSEMDTKFSAIKQAAEDIGTNTRRGIEAGMQTHLTNLRNITDDMVGVAEGARDRISGVFDNIDLSWAGRSAAQSFANGFSGVYIPTPHMYVSDWDYNDLGDSWFYTPRFSVGWWKSGGLFKGGRGQVIGIAEDNRDEAVLPLENKRAMSRIADSIVNSSGSGMGISTDDIADAVVQAMVMMQGNQQSPIFHIEVKTEDNEVLARAVTKGQQSIDYRNNPTPKFVY